MTQDQRPPSFANRLARLDAGADAPTPRPDSSVPVYEDEWWIEHVEGEAGESLEEDLRVLLRNSASGRLNRAAWLRARAAIKNADEAEAWLASQWGLEREERAREAIMAALEGVEIEALAEGSPAEPRIAALRLDDA